ncbi:MAG: DNA-3-methyladenine glycosylase I [Alphaproteobacteria bacterium]|jgi:3-methyladenine DNA glycosylase Tag|nr:DNA-3-methyladenine glycosylase I [Alphaproteobacteria bacterium]MDP6237372.1 DNA-3-methyladenine glycosylase I [Alphaproteobacteria bacterium]MDP7173697.1 DNA-3-methyladenine glycosylase I [Alphaproteobacteria bacterium]MDP7234935.1 DNA-3-methyladenine glycosylase I [Alphaproteobacteria bacterium]MDP7487595.1 DNA-3-methyladenine glycosylase I [Alphaproteobacteria bacterium]|tara:strand:+ start:760 stop:1428 length:669 start_codon:yes stop_codon:yes gene_type:complete
MKSFDSYRKRALANCGSEEALVERMPEVKSARALCAIKDDRYLSRMSQRVFSAGLKHDMVAKKWPAFEEAFLAFVPARVANMPEEDVEALMQDRRLIRHWPKIKSVPANARAMIEVTADTGSFGKWVTAWPVDDTVGLWADIGKRFTQMGGASSPYFLRWVGKDTFMITPDVTMALIEAEVVTRKPTAKKELAAVQEAFNAWAAESGRSLSEISRTLALAMG